MWWSLTGAAAGPAKRQPAPVSILEMPPYEPTLKMEAMPPRNPPQTEHTRKCWRRVDWDDLNEIFTQYDLHSDRVKHKVHGYLRAPFRARICEAQS
ncbi:hypothetical protein T265_12322 [Opisthorchis viverrini]|uniref:Uncharacterized protein n=1 Tax=Opisthorchis viverrini TaxID=6198 RepID=A0A074ZSP1_OPIVI|nr:hypothetical protein T265_12322 [Opisthorchis viverrini]KER18284.1 hypothetical protein T265_12322 [Opisthorchis viverrini]